MTLTQEQFQKARAAGLSTEQIIQFEKKRQQTQPAASSTPQPKPSMSTMGVAGYAKAHPFKTAFQDPVETVTGKSLLERSQSSSVGKPPTNPLEFLGSYGAGLTRDVGALAIGSATSPAALATGGIGALPVAGKTVAQVAGKAIAGSKVGKMVGGVLNTPIEDVAKGVTKPFKSVGRFFARIKTRLNPKTVKSLNVSPTQRVGDLRSKANVSFQQEESVLKKDIGTIQQEKGLGVRELNYQAKDLRFNVTKEVNESRQILKQNLQKLGQELKKSSEEGSATFQEKLPEFFQANGEAYGTRLDEISDALITSGQGITRKEVSGLIDKTLSELDEAFVTSGPAREAVEFLKQKYTPKMIGESSKFISAKTGEGVGGALRSNADDAVDFEGLVQDLRRVRTNLTSGARTGTTGFAQEDLAVQFLNNNLGDYVKKFSPEFAQLQQDYMPVIRAMKTAHKVFRPSQGIYSSEGGASFLRRAASGKTRAGEPELLSTLEEGTGFAKGVGGISESTKKVGAIQGKIKEEVSQGPARLRQNLQKQLKSIEDKKRDLITSSETNIANKQRILEKRQAALQKRLADLDKTRKKIIQLQANKQQAKLLRNSILTAGGIAGGITTAIKLGD